MLDGAETRVEQETWQQRLGGIPADFYHRQDVLEAEIERVFKPSWLCIGFTQDLQNHQDFVTAQVGPHSIVVQNFHGELKAFRNVCSHRFSRIQCDRTGNRLLQCPYHGWTYNGAGRPVGIPLNKQSFGFNEADKAALALRAYELGIVGHFVFVRMIEDGPDLRGFLGGFYDDLLEASQTCSDRFEHDSFTWDCNWKLTMDNAGEGYHVPMVHPESFAVILSSDLTITTDRDHSRYVGKLKERSLKWWGAVAKSTRMTTGTRYPDYASFLIFPNIVVTYSYGALLTFQTFDPVSAGQVRVTNASWLANNDGRAARDTVVAGLKAFTAAVRNEDEAICRIAQAGTREAGTRAPLLGELEGRVAHFQRAYAGHMRDFT